ncbi:AraC family transcriptional regulator [Paenibacillus sp. 481]|uniref:AraC family transcriptional regulator n=1 Tax=Paenibacillus sp. 481 TaxID=2835869 RepID=UPI001E364A7A|nr:AraC family transcriptional regulator [Paenibacillus sp. 481]UHA74842.1 AraC family transcriptional regulator [Paenibacillus sp. 481]
MKELASLKGLLIELLNIEIIKEEQASLNIEQFTETHMLIAAVSGRGEVMIDERSYLLRQDTVYVCAPGQTYVITVDPKEALELFVIRFDLFRASTYTHRTERGEHSASYVIGKDIFYDKEEIPIYAAAQMATLCTSMYNYWLSEDELERFRSSLLFHKLFYHLIKSARSIPNDSLTLLERAKEYMNNHFHHNLSIEQLAGIAEVSPKYFVDLFKKTYGVSAIDYLTELRMNQAKLIMARSNVRLRDVAQQIGYNDEFYFSRKFKQVIGVSPSVYMQSRRRKIAAYGPAVLGYLFALNIIPYAAPLHPKWTAYYYKMYRTHIPVHLNAYRYNYYWEANLEALRQAQPDIIVSTDELSSNEQEQLNGIAPVCYAPRTGEGWRQQLRQIAECLGAAKEAELWLSSYERKVASAREILHRELKNDTFLFIRMVKNNYYLYSSRSMAEAFHGDLQLAPAHSYGQAVVDEPLTLEQLAEINPDRIMLLIFQEADTWAHWRELQHFPQWQKLSAVRNNHVTLISSDVWLEHSPLGHERIVNEVLDLISGNRAN